MGTELDWSLLNPEAATWLGRHRELAPYVVTALDIARFALAIDNHNPIHYDRDKARLAGYPDVVAPLGYYAAIRIAVRNLTPLRSLKADGTSSSDTPPSRATRQMAGAVKARFHRPIFAEDNITLHETIVDVTEKIGRTGPLGIITYKYAYVNQHGQLAVEEDYTRVLRS